MSGASDDRADFDIEVFFDGDCPLCAKEIAMLRRWDREKRILFTDIAAIDFSSGGPGRSFDQLMASMHGRLPDGTWIDGVEVFRRMYAAVGFRRLVSVTRLPGVAWTLDRLYAVFAKHRLRLTGRCHDGACRVPTAVP